MTQHCTDRPQWGTLQVFQRGQKRTPAGWVFVCRICGQLWRQSADEHGDLRYERLPARVIKVKGQA